MRARLLTGCLIVMIILSLVTVSVSAADASSCGVQLKLSESTYKTTAGAAVYQLEYQVKGQPDGNAYLLNGAIVTVGGTAFELAYLDGGVGKVSTAVTGAYTDFSALGAGYYTTAAGWAPSKTAVLFDGSKYFLRIEPSSEQANGYSDYTTLMTFYLIAKDPAQTVSALLGAINFASQTEAVKYGTNYSVFIMQGNTACYSDSNVASYPVTGVSYAEIPAANLKKVAPTGVSISGKVTGYAPKVATTIELKQSGVTKYTTTIEALASGSGIATQTFTLNGVQAGTYDLVVSKTGHLPFTLTGVTVGNANIDLAASANANYNNIKLLAGDVNGDGYINVDDLNIVWNDSNYNKPVAAAANGVTDLNGDGYVNVDDLNLVWNDANYNKNKSAHSTASY